VLDRAEGLGFGYKETDIPVSTQDGKTLNVRTYLAAPSAVENGLRPYTWYKAFVVGGAAEHRLPSAYVETYIESVLAIAGPDKLRRGNR
jgi:hypothetical protein